MNSRTFQASQPIDQKVVSEDQALRFYLKELSFYPFRMKHELKKKFSVTIAETVVEGNLFELCARFGNRKCIETLLGLYKYYSLFYDQLLLSNSIIIMHVLENKRGVDTQKKILNLLSESGFTLDSKTIQKIETNKLSAFQVQTKIYQPHTSQIVKSTKILYAPSHNYRPEPRAEYQITMDRRKKEISQLLEDVFKAKDDFPFPLPDGIDGKRAGKISKILKSSTLNDAIEKASEFYESDEDYQDLTNKLTRISYNFKQEARKKAAATKAEQVKKLQNLQILIVASNVTLTQIDRKYLTYEDIGKLNRQISLNMGIANWEITDSFLNDDPSESGEKRNNINLPIKLIEYSTSELQASNALIKELQIRENEHQQRGSKLLSAFTQLKKLFHEFSTLKSDIEANVNFDETGSDLNNPEKFLLAEFSKKIEAFLLDAHNLLSKADIEAFLLKAQESSKIPVALIELELELERSLKEYNEEIQQKIFSLKKAEPQAKENAKLKLNYAIKQIETDSKSIFVLFPKLSDEELFVKRPAILAFCKKLADLQNISNKLAGKIRLETKSLNDITVINDEVKAYQGLVHGKLHELFLKRLDNCRDRYKVIMTNLENIPDQEHRVVKTASAIDLEFKTSFVNFMGCKDLLPEMAVLDRVLALSDSTTPFAQWDAHITALERLYHSWEQQHAKDLKLACQNLQQSIQTAISMVKELKKHNKQDIVGFATTSAINDLEYYTSLDMKEITTVIQAENNKNACNETVANVISSTLNQLKIAIKGYDNRFSKKLEFTKQLNLSDEVTKTIEKFDKERDVLADLKDIPNPDKESPENFVKKLSERIDNINKKVEKFKQLNTNFDNELEKLKGSLDKNYADMINELKTKTNELETYCLLTYLTIAPTINPEAIAERMRLNNDLITLPKSTNITQAEIEQIKTAASDSDKMLEHLKQLNDYHKQVYDNCIAARADLIDYIDMLDDLRTKLQVDVTLDCEIRNMVTQAITLEDEIQILEAKQRILAEGEQQVTSEIDRLNKIKQEREQTKQTELEQTIENVRQAAQLLLEINSKASFPAHKQLSLMPDLKTLKDFTKLAVKTEQVKELSVTQLADETNKWNFLCIVLKTAIDYEVSQRLTALIYRYNKVLANYEPLLVQKHEIITQALECDLKFRNSLQQTKGTLTFKSDGPLKQIVLDEMCQSASAPKVLQRLDKHIQSLEKLHDDYIKDERNKLAKAHDQIEPVIKHAEAILAKARVLGFGPVTPQNETVATDNDPWTILADAVNAATFMTKAANLSSDDYANVRVALHNALQPAQDKIVEELIKLVKPFQESFAVVVVKFSEAQVKPGKMPDAVKKLQESLGVQSKFLNRIELADIKPNYNRLSDLTPELLKKFLETYQKIYNEAITELNTEFECLNNEKQFQEDAARKNDEIQLAGLKAEVQAARATLQIVVEDLSVFGDKDHAHLGLAKSISTIQPIVPCESQDENQANNLEFLRTQLKATQKKITSVTDLLKKACKDNETYDKELKKLQQSLAQLDQKISKWLIPTELTENQAKLAKKCLLLKEALDQKPAHSELNLLQTELNQIKGEFINLNTLVQQHKGKFDQHKKDLQKSLDEFAEVAPKFKILDTDIGQAEELAAEIRKNLQKPNLTLTEIENLQKKILVNATFTRNDLETALQTFMQPIAAKDVEASNSLQPDQSKKKKTQIESLKTLMGQTTVISFFSATSESKPNYTTIAKSSLENFETFVDEAKAQKQFDAATTTLKTVSTSPTIAAPQMSAEPAEASRSKQVPREPANLGKKRKKKKKPKKVNNDSAIIPSSNAHTHLSAYLTDLKKFIIDSISKAQILSENFSNRWIYSNERQLLQKDLDIFLKLLENHKELVFNEANVMRALNNNVMRTIQLYQNKPSYKGSNAFDFESKKEPSFQLGAWLRAKIRSLWQDNIYYDHAAFLADFAKRSHDIYKKHSYLYEETATKKQQKSVPNTTPNVIPQKLPIAKPPLKPTVEKSLYPRNKHNENKPVLNKPTSTFYYFNPQYDEKVKDILAKLNSQKPNIPGKK